MKKTYLSNQIQLITLTTYDLMTPDEVDLSYTLAQTHRAMEELKKRNKKNHIPDFRERYEILLAKSRNIAFRLNTLVRSYPDKPRRVLLSNVLLRAYERQPYVTWDSLRVTRRIAEFSSEESRAMGLETNEITFDKIIIKWKSLDILKQIVLHGFYMPVLVDGEVVEKHYHFMTASAGQLRTDKIQCISDESWEKVEPRLTCGMTPERINAHGGINVNKYLAYLALATSATDQWNFDINRCIVAKDMITPVTGMMDYIDKDYSITRAVRTVEINHIDGAGIMLPSVSRFCKMVRGPWIKGLLAPFDFIRFCEEHNVPPVLEDVWGQMHNLVEEKIEVIFTESQIKLSGYYDSWEDYKRCFRECGCSLCHTNFEEPYIPDTEINYQMLQTLQTLTNEEIKEFTKPTFDKISSIGKNRKSMLSALDAAPDSIRADKRALAIYPPLLRDKYFHDMLLDVKRKWTLDAKSGRIRCANKRLFVVPDLYALCEYYFLHEEHPNGLLRDGEVASRLFRKAGKVDCLRSPHLYMEHAIRTVVDDDNVYKWFTSNAIYVSVHDLISRILQFDCDGDQLNVVSDPIIVNCAEREINEFGIVPLFYDAEKAPKQQITQEAFFDGLKRAHDFSFIGEVSNSLCRLWNRPNPNLKAAALLCYYNNQIIDAAKTGKINSYEAYPAIYKMITKAIGGKAGRMPYFFQFSKNGRRITGEKEKVDRTNDSTMNRICAAFSKVGNITMNYDEIPSFNWKMLLGEEYVSDDNGPYELFCSMDDEVTAVYTAIAASNAGVSTVARNNKEYHLQQIMEKLIEVYGSLDAAFPSIVKNLFSEDNYKKGAHKQTFWNIFGEMVVENLQRNIDTNIFCNNCGASIPPFDANHVCQSKHRLQFACAACGAMSQRTNNRQKLCLECQTKSRLEYKRNYNRQAYLKSINETAQIT